MPKTTILTVTLILVFSLSFSQSKFPSGYWYGVEDVFAYKDLNGVYVFEDDEIYRAAFNKEVSRFTKWVSFPKNNQDFIFSETSVRAKNNAQHTWINTCETCVWTETQTGNFFYFGNPYLLEYNWTRNVNNDKGEDCFRRGNPCFTSSKKGYARIVPSKVYRNVVVGGKGYSYIDIEEVRYTEKTTEVTLKFTDANTTGTLHPPGSEKAYKIIGQDGKEYKLLAQFGWRGLGSKGFGGSRGNIRNKRIILFFEPMSQKANPTFNLKEGACSSNCWNFYDVAPK